MIGRSEINDPNLIGACEHRLTGSLRYFSNIYSKGQIRNCTLEYPARFRIPALPDNVWHCAHGIWERENENVRDILE
jgi:hypothetical protein